jgi:hypothetical protein
MKSCSCLKVRKIQKKWSTSMYTKDSYKVTEYENLKSTCNDRECNMFGLPHAYLTIYLRHQLNIWLLPYNWYVYWLRWKHHLWSSSFVLDYSGVHILQNHLFLVIISQLNGGVTFHIQIKLNVCLMFTSQLDL